MWRFSVYPRWETRNNRHSAKKEKEKGKKDSVATDGREAVF